MKEFGRAPDRAPRAGRGSAPGPGRLGALEPAAKGVYTLWMVFALVHFASSFGMYWDRTIRNPPESSSHLEAVAVYYRGNDALATPKPFGRLMEITHQHLFAMPLTLLVASHLYLMTRRSIREKRTVIAAGALAMSLHVAAPWLVRYGGAGWAWAMPVTGIPFGATFAWMTIAPMKDMWLGLGAPKAHGGGPVQPEGREGEQPP